MEQLKGGHSIDACQPLIPQLAFRPLGIGWQRQNGRTTPSADGEGSQTTMATGTVKWFNDQKGYGFIQPDNGGKDVFVHISAVERAGLRGLSEGQKVSYEVQSDRRTGKESAVDLKV